MLAHNLIQELEATLPEGLFITLLQYRRGRGWRVQINNGTNVDGLDLPVVWDDLVRLAQMRHDPDEQC